ncbi:unnamed protein product [Rhizoctonia solani]|uniref:Uncharacterized protein n=1 Tax=Rhizoctonia solani TaxID=456999 RepID=A0A8H3DWD0_9AGAM|nr:unnamed protein product [Rhizoctonia solani]
MIRPVEHPEWGPGFQEYIRTFHRRLHSAFDKYIDEEEVIVDTSRDLIPLRLLETTLAVGENMHLVGFQTGDRIFPALIGSLRKYSALYGERIFDHYYGFLCVRHLVRMVCIGVLNTLRKFEATLEELSPDMPWVRLLNVLSNATFLCAGELLRKYDDSIFLEGPLFLDDAALSSNDAKFLQDLLWKNRDLIIPLCTQDALPGLPALILVTSQLIGYTLTPADETGHDWLGLMDISLRCYLGCLSGPAETGEECHVLRRVTGFAVGRLENPNLVVTGTFDVWLAVDEEDARTITEMYSNLPNPESPATPLNLHYIILRWVFTTLSNPRRPALEELALGVFKTALAMMQAEIDQESEGLMSKYSRGMLTICTRDVVEHINTFVSNKPKPEVQRAFFVALIDSNIYGTIGRVLALITREKGTGN